MYRGNKKQHCPCHHYVCIIVKVSNTCEVHVCYDTEMVLQLSNESVRVKFALECPIARYHTTHVTKPWDICACLETVV
jgi:hypothetical protein